MLALQIDDPIIEENLKARFNSPQKLKDYLYALVKNDMDVDNAEKQNESMKILSSIQKGLADIKAKKTQPIDKLWEQLDD